MEQPTWLTPTEAARLFGVHVTTVKRWASDGRVPAFRTPGKQWKFSKDTVLALIAAGDLPREEASA